MAMSSSISGLGTRVGFRADDSRPGPAAERPAATARSAARGLDVSGSSTSAGTLAVLLGRLSLGNDRSPPETAGTGTLVEPAPRPNLDALNRVLNHYAAQTAAASLPFIVES